MAAAALTTSRSIDSENEKLIIFAVARALMLAVARIDVVDRSSRDDAGVTQRMD